MEQNEGQGDRRNDLVARISMVGCFLAATAILLSGLSDAAHRSGSTPMGATTNVVALK
jgi:hypothetical protein